MNAKKQAVTTAQWEKAKAELARVKADAKARQLAHQKQVKMLKQEIDTLKKGLKALEVAHRVALQETYAEGFRDAEREAQALARFLAKEEAAFEKNWNRSAQGDHAAPTKPMVKRMSVSQRSVKPTSKKTITSQKTKKTKAMHSSLNRTRVESEIPTSTVENAPTSDRVPVAVA